MTANRSLDPVISEFSDEAEEAPKEVLLEIYKEVCLSYHAIDDFRTKLLGILPITSLAGILLLGKDNLFAAGGIPSQRLVGFGSFFAAAFTLSLFLFEIRGILRSDHLIKRGKDLEQRLNVRGQFFVCARQHQLGDTLTSEKIFNAKVAASAIYSLVFSAWLFLALKFTFGFHIIGCGLTATLLGALLAIATNNLIREKVPA